MFILFIIAGMILAFGIILLIIRIQYIRNGIIAEATLVELYIVKSTNSEDPDTLHRTYKYYTRNNEEITIQSEDGVESGRQIGDKAPIVYQTYNPQHVVFLNYWSSFGLVTVLFCIALVLILIAAGYYWAEDFFNNLQ